VAANTTEIEGNAVFRRATRTARQRRFAPASRGILARRNSFARSALEKAGV
jgi:hypothetical protein